MCHAARGATMDVKAEIITIGNELLKGLQADTNSSYLADRLASRGILVCRITSVGDDFAAIHQALSESIERSQLVLVTGGLGPTSDDITTEAVSQLLQRPLRIHEQALQHLLELARAYGLAMTNGQRKQALLPEGAELIANPIGTAPGYSLQEKRCRLFVLPGVPAEVTAMTEESILPRLEQEWHDRPWYRSRTLKVFGISEARADELLGDLIKTEKVQISFLPHLPELHIGFAAHSADLLKCEETLKHWEGMIRRRLEPYVFGADDETMESVVGTLLANAQATIAVAESCTGGLIGHCLTNVPGSSSYVDRVLVTYSNQAKVDLLKVPTEVIRAHGAVSELTARYMAEGVRLQAGSTLGLATTGIAGPGGGTPEKPVGTVYIALADGNDTWVKRYQFPGGRLRVKMLTAQVALNRVREYLLHKSEE